MTLKPWLLAPFLLALSGCFGTLPVAQGKIDPPPANLTAQCLVPDDLADGSTALDLAKWAADWIDAYGCERSKRAGLIEAWPR